MPEDEYEPEDLVEEGEDEDDEEDEGDDEPTTVFVAMTFGKDGGPAAEESYKVIAGACDRLGMDAQRLPKNPGTEAIYEAVETSDFAVIDVSCKRPTLAQELEVIGHEIDPAFVVFIARTGSPKLPEIERAGGGREVNFYADKGDLRAMIERHLNTMLDAWQEGATDDDEDDEEA